MNLLLLSYIEDLHTLQSVLLKREYQSQGVVIKVYHNTENGISNTSYFMEDLWKKHKKIGFSGAGDPHQNGTAERAMFFFAQ